MSQPFSLETLAEYGPIYGPAGDAPAPGIIILHGAEGPMAGWAHRYALILAAQGFLALPYAYGEGDFFGAGPIVDVSLSRLRDALSAFNDHPRCTGMGMFGWSRGAEKALLFASLMGDDTLLKCVAVHAPSNRVMAAIAPADLRAGNFTRNTGPDALRSWAWDDAPGSPLLIPGAEIEIERFPGPVFLSVGLADEVLDSGMTLKLAQRLTDAGRVPDLMTVKGQGHAYDFETEPMLWHRLAVFFNLHLR